MRRTSRTCLMVAVLGAMMGVQEGEALAACVDPPGPHQVTVWQHKDFGGACTTLDIGSYPNSTYLAPVPNDAISSLKVGTNVRAHLFKDHNFEGSVALYEAGSWHNIAWPGSFGLGPNVDNKTTSIIVQPTFGVRIPYIFVNDYPSDRENIFAHQTQGLCHTSDSWFITTNRPSKLYKIPLNADLNAENPSRAEIGIPSFLQDKGYHHMGDPDCIKGFIFVPLEHESYAAPAVVVVYRASDLAFVNCDDLYVNSDYHSGWVAIDPSNGFELWASSTELFGAGTQGLFTYHIDWSQVVPGGGYIFYAGAGPAVVLKNRIGEQLRIKGMQGGVFDPTGQVLYLSNSDRDSADGHGIHVFLKNTGTWLGETGNDYGLFRYTTSGLGEEEEEEGLDYLPLGYGDGELHAMMLHNGWYWRGVQWTSDSVYIKHYKSYGQ